jgi:hypothetical protein
MSANSTVELRKILETVRVVSSGEKKSELPVATADEWTAAEYTAGELATIAMEWRIPEAQVKKARLPSGKHKKDWTAERGLALLLVSNSVPFIERGKWCNGDGRSESGAMATEEEDESDAEPPQKKQRGDDAGLQLAVRMLEEKEKGLREREAAIKAREAAVEVKSQKAQLLSTSEPHPRPSKSRVSTDNGGSGSGPSAFGGVSSHSVYQVEGDSGERREEKSQAKTGAFVFALPSSAPSASINPSSKFLAQLDSGALSTITNKQFLPDLRKARPTWAGKLGKDGVAVAMLAPSENGGFALQSSVTQPDMAVEDFMLCLQTYLLAVTFCWPEQAKNVIAYQYQVFQLRYLRLPVAKLQARDQEWRRAIAMNGWDWSHGNQDREALIITVDSMQVPAERTEASPVLSSNTRSNFHRRARGGVSVSGQGQTQYSGPQHGGNATTAPAVSGNVVISRNVRISSAVKSFCSHRRLCYHFQTNSCTYSPCSFGHHCYKCIGIGKSQDDSTHPGLPCSTSFKVPVDNA